MCSICVAIPTPRPQCGSNQLTRHCGEWKYPRVVRTGFILDDPDDPQNVQRTDAWGEVKDFAEDPLAKQAPTWDAKLMWVCFSPVNGKENISWIVEGGVKESNHRISVQPNVEFKRASKRSTVKDLGGSIGRNKIQYSSLCFHGCMTKNHCFIVNSERAFYLQAPCCAVMFLQEPWMDKLNTREGLSVSLVFSGHHWVRVRKGLFSWL